MQQDGLVTISTTDIGLLDLFVLIISKKGRYMSMTMMRTKCAATIWDSYLNTVVFFETRSTFDA